MQYGIRLSDGHLVQFLSEYNNNSKVLSFRTKEDAQLHAENIGLSSFMIVEINDNTASK